jgi:hypothetical protein
VSDVKVQRRPEYYIRTGSMFENPFGVPRDEIIHFILTNTPEIVAQVVFGKYVESSGLVFTGELIQQMIDRSLPLVRTDAYIDRECLEKARAKAEYYRDRWVNPFHTGIDFARQTDYTVISTIDTSVRPARLVYWKRLNRVPWETIYREVGRAAYLWGPNLLCDGSGPGGDVVMDALHSRLYCPKHKRCVLIENGRCMRDGQMMNCRPDDYIALSCADAYYFGSGQGMAKKELVEHLRNILSVGYDSPESSVPFGLLRMPPIPQIEEEMTFYTWDDKKLVTDALFSLALAVWSGLEDVPAEPVVGSTMGV